MHFSIPDTQEFDNSSGNPYVAYNIHINGLFHCSVRYKQLLNLHEQLLKSLDVPLPSFPPKKFFPLTVNQQEDRRLALERYIQNIGQNKMINTSDILNGFLLSAQQETGGKSIKNESINVVFMNGQSIVVNISTVDSSKTVLKKICRQLNLQEQLDVYFALFMVIINEGHVNVLRRLQDFESPLITQENIGAFGVRLMFAKGYWNIGFDMELMRDPVGLELLYIQTLSEIEQGCIPLNDEVTCRLREAQNRGEKREFLEVARTMKYYGYVNFVPCYCDYLYPEAKVIVAIGRNELRLRTVDETKAQEAEFKVTRMHCWRITSLHNNIETSEKTSERSLELSFEYLVAKNQLEWITISSEQAILMSVCLQAMIDELLFQNAGADKAAVLPGKSWTYIMRDGHSRRLMGSTSSDNICKVSEDEESGSRKTEPIIKTLVKRFSAGKSNSLSEKRTTVVEPIRRYTNDCDIMENNAFHTIGDDDL
ncbi:sorting nexin-17 [Venturia canescens]|uniref:sorting nexin-17 n=1 Tax=Venturia canescens TaxID=32260 RepID=UPI001C9C7BAC|nr:sorting nexin-17 [Venturia canescens]XP_043272281.1 sorting nexin-17 [Venturia canescens]